MAKAEKKRRWRIGANGENSKFFRDWGFDLSGTDGPVVHMNPGLLWSLLRARPDAVILGGYDSATTALAAVMLKIREIPPLLWIESTLSEQTLTRRPMKPLIRSIVRMSGGVLVPGSAAREYARSLGTPDERIFVAPNSVDVTAFAPGANEEWRSKAKERLGLTDGPVCLYVGRLHEKKGLLDLLLSFKRVVAMHPESQLLIVGSGPLRRGLETFLSMNSDLESCVSVRDHCDYDELPQIYAAADMFVFPTHNDVWGMVVNEAMSMGLPVISSTSAGATEDLVEDGSTGLLVRPHDIQALANAMIRLVKDSSVRRQMGRRGREHILGGFTPEIQAQAITDAIWSLLDRKARK